LRARRHEEAGISRIFSLAQPALVFDLGGSTPADSRGERATRRTENKKERDYFMNFKDSNGGGRTRKKKETRHRLESVSLAEKAKLYFTNEKEAA